MALNDPYDIRRNAAGRNEDLAREVEAQRRKALARKKDALFTSEEAIAYDRGVVQSFDKVSQEPPARDVQDQVMPNVPHDEERHL